MTDLLSNSNSFSSCFQFNEHPKEDLLYRRVKIYDKVQAFIQTMSASNRLGMNTDAIFYPTHIMSRKLQEAEEFGITRIEISYYADSFEAYQQYFHPDFLELA